MAEKERASRQVIVISLITAACLIGDSMLYIVLPICFAQAGLSSLWEVGIILSVNLLVRLPLNPMVGWLYRHISDRTWHFHRHGTRHHHHLQLRLCGRLCRLASSALPVGYRMDTVAAWRLLLHPECIVRR